MLKIKKGWERNSVPQGTEETILSLCIQSIWYLGALFALSSRGEIFPLKEVVVTYACIIIL